MNTNLKIEICVQHVPEHFNINAQANIPAVWEAEVTDGMAADRPGSHSYYYYHADTRQSAIDGLKRDLQERGFHGTMHVIG